VRRRRGRHLATARDSAAFFLHISEMPKSGQACISRRSLLKGLALGTAGAALGARGARSTEIAKVDVHDPQAVALGYVENASQVDAKKYPQYVAGSNCDNCLQLQGKPGNNYRPCTLFAGKLVAVSGWCSGWTAEM
jgi:High potential iron-sulfur protein